VKIDYRYQNYKNTKSGLNNKLKMKWKTINWIMENKKEMLNKFFLLQKVFFTRFKQKVFNINIVMFFLYNLLNIY